MKSNINKANSMFKNAFTFVNNYHEDVCPMRFASKRLEKEYEDWKEHISVDDYGKELVAFIECYTRCSQYLGAFYAMPASSCHKIIITVMVFLGYSEEVIPHAMLVIKQVWKYGIELGDIA